MMLGARTAHGRGRPVPMPAWVPSAAWQWVDIPGTRWSDYFKDNGSGIGPAVASNLGGYAPVWSFSGSAYSRKNHEFWLFGGGHQGTTANVLTKTRTGVSPGVEMVCAPSSNATRAGIFDRPSYLALGGYWPDGKPFSPHSYGNNLFNDWRDEFISVGLEFVASSGDGTSIQGQAEGFNCMAAFVRGASAWQPPGTYANLPSNLNDLAFVRSGPRLLSDDGSTIYYWPDGYGLYKFTYATNAHTAIGGTNARPSGPVAGNGNMSLHVSRDTNAGVVIKTCNLTNGIQTTLTVTGDSLPTGLTCYGVEYVASLGLYVAMWINTTAWNQMTGSITSLYVGTIAVSGANAVLSLKTLSGSPPTVAGSIAGLGYDPTFGCVVAMMDQAQPVKAFKVA